MIRTPFLAQGEAGVVKAMAMLAHGHGASQGLPGNECSLAQSHSQEVWASGAIAIKAGVGTSCHSN